MLPEKFRRIRRRDPAGNVYLTVRLPFSGSVARVLDTDAT